MKSLNEHIEGLNESKGEKVKDGKGWVYKTVDLWGNIRYRNEKGKLHKTDGPSVEYKDRHKAWWINGVRHREDGPAIIWSDGEEWYYLNDKRYSKKDWEKEVKK